MWLVQRAFNIPGKWTVLTLMPVAILLVANMDMGYWVYFIKQPGYFYVATIGTTVATALVWAYRVLNEGDKQSFVSHLSFQYLFPVITCIVGYPLFGVYALAATALMAVLSWRISSQPTSVTNKLVTSIVALLSMIAVPLLCYRYVYYGTTSQTSIGWLSRRLSLPRVTLSTIFPFMPWPSVSC